MMAVVMFDAYGTLFDLQAFARVAESVIDEPSDAIALADKWRRLHLEFAWQSALMERYQDFDKLSAQALDAALKQVNFPQDKAAAVRSALLGASSTLPLYDDVRPTLQQLDARSAIFSNGTLHTLQKLADTAGILFSFDFILSVDPVRTYKPSRKSYAFAMSRMNTDKSDVTFVSANAWDIAGAKAFGFRTCWCNRTEKTFDGLSFQPDIVIADLRQLNEHLS